MVERKALPFSWTLSSIYAFYFAALGGVIPFLSLYFESIGFSPKDIGLLMSTILITKIIAPNFWGYFIDRFAHQYPWLQSKTTSIALVVCCVMFMLLNFTEQFWWIASCMFIYSFFWNAVLPQMESIVYIYLGDRKHQYGKIRVWGSIGFIISVVGIGWITENYGIAWLLPILTTIFVFLAMHGLLMRKVPLSSDSNQGDKQFLHILTPSIILVLALGMIGQMTHAPFYTFFSIYLESYGYSKTLIGGLWAFGVIAEVGVFIFAHHLFIRFKLINILLMCFVFTTVRWLMLSQFPETLSLMIFSQSLHAISFGLYHSTASQFINAHFKGQFQVRGQALYSSLTFGIGGAIGTLTSGYLWSAYGGQTVFLLCAIVMAIATVLGMIFSTFLRT